MSIVTVLGKKDGRFRIGWDEKRGSVAIDIEGFWSNADMHDFLPVLHGGLARSQARHGDALVLIDLCKAGVMANSLFAAFITDGTKPMPPSTRVAIVLTSTIQKLQVKRIAVGDEKTEFFDSHEKAVRWLHEPADTAASTPRPADRRPTEPR